MFYPGTLAISEPSWHSPSDCALEVLSFTSRSDYLPGVQRGDFVSPAFEVKEVASLLVLEPAFSCTANIA